MVKQSRAHEFLKKAKLAVDKYKLEKKEIRIIEARK